MSLPQPPPSFVASSNFVPQSNFVPIVVSAKGESDGYQVSIKTYRYIIIIMFVVIALVFAWTFYNRNLSGRNTFGILNKQQKKQVDGLLEQVNAALANVVIHQSPSSWNWSKAVQEIVKASTLLDVLDDIVPKTKQLSHSKRQDIMRDNLKKRLAQLNATVNFSPHGPATSV